MIIKKTHKKPSLSELFFIRLTWTPLKKISGSACEPVHDILILITSINRIAQATLRIHLHVVCGRLEVFARVR